MAQIVEVKGVGKLKFPDDMTNEEMADAIYSNFPELKPKPEPSGLMERGANALKSVADSAENPELNLQSDTGSKIADAGRRGPAPVANDPAPIEPQPSGPNGATGSFAPEPQTGGATGSFAAPMTQKEKQQSIEALNQDYEALTPVTTELESEAAAIELRHDALNQAAKSLDRTSQQQVDNYNQAADQLNSRLEAFNAKQSDYQAQIEELQQRQNEIEDAPAPPAPDWNMFRAAAERVGDLAGGALTAINAAATYGEEVLPLGGFVWKKNEYLPSYKTGEEYAKFLEEGGEEIVAVAADQMKNLDVGYVPNYTWKALKKKFAEDGAMSGSAWGEVLAYGAEQGIKSIPDMVAVTLSLPAYVLARSGEIGETRAKNNGKDETELSDVLWAAPFALGSAILERIGAKGITKAGAESVGKEALKRGIAYAAARTAQKGGKAGGREAGTELVQEGIIEYLGEKFGTDAAMSFAEAGDRGLAGAVGGGVYGTVAGGTMAAGREATRPSPAGELGLAFIDRIDNSEFVSSTDQGATASLDPANAQMEVTQQGGFGPDVMQGQTAEQFNQNFQGGRSNNTPSRPSMGDLVAAKLKERGIDVTPKQPGEMPGNVDVPLQPVRPPQEDRQEPQETGEAAFDLTPFERNKLRDSGVDDSQLMDMPTEQARQMLADIEQKPAEAERRQDPQTRRRVAEMTQYEMRQALLEDDLTGLGNRRAYAENERKPVQVSADADSLKWINDNMSHGAGDQMLEAIGRAFKARGADAYHPSGDEFWLQANTQQEADQIMQDVSAELENAVIEFELPNGERITKRGIGLSYGTADTIEAAEQQLQANKTAREQAGQRAGRGETPPGISRTGGNAGVSEKATTGNQDSAGDTAGRAEGVNSRKGEVGGTVSQGEVLTTATGRETTPVPKIGGNTPRKTANAVKRLEQWLIDNATEEARARGDDFNLRQFENINPKNISQADKDSAEQYLFGDEQPPVIPSILKSLSSGEQRNEPTELDQPGQEPLAGEPAETVPEPEETGDAGTDAETGSGEDVSGGDAAGGSRVSAGRSIPDGEGNVPVSTGGTGERATGQQRARDSERSTQDNGQNTRSGQPATRGSKGSIDATEEAAEEAPTPKGATTQRAGPAGDRPARFFTLTPEMNIGAGGAKTKFKNNLKAIQTLKQLNEEGRQATPEEQQILAGYVGWGGIPQAFMGDNGKITKGWEKEAKQLKEALTEAEYDAARRSTQDAHYTSPEIVTEIWKAVQGMGFQGGRVLEPSVGTGNFLGFMPGGVRSKSSIAGVELDHITGGIAQKLYPGANIQAPMGFQEFTMPDGYFDLAIGNPPFGNQKLYDGKRKALSKMSIHNYFFAKSMAGLKPNGVLAMVVSSRLMDGNNKMARDYLSDRADLLGAVRLPNNAFLKNAGTEVTTDIIFLRKRREGEQAAGESWSTVKTVKDAKGIEIPLNEYFDTNPNMMLGEWGAFGSMYGPNEPALVAKEGQDTNALLQEALASLPKGFMDNAGADPVSEEVTLPTSVDNVKVGSMFLDGDQISIRLESEMGQARSEPVEMPSKKAEERVRGLIKVRDVFADLRKAQLTEGVKDEALSALRDRLNRAYDQFVKKNGPINLDANKRLFRDDPTWPQLAALEESFDKGISATVAKKTGETARPPSAEKAAIFRTRTQQPYKAPDKATTAKDALTASLSEKGMVDMAYMGELYGKTESAMVAELGELVFESSPGNWESRDEYLSGNVKQKLATAERMAKDMPRFQRNIDALKEVQPEDIEAVDIRVKPGAHWLPPEVVTEFADHILGNANGKATYNPVMAKWNIKGSPTVAAESQYGTDRAAVSDILTAAANDKNMVIRDRVDESTTVINESATNAANEKIQRVKAEFRRWLWQDDARRNRLVRLYNDTFNTDRVRKYDGSHLTFPGKVGDDILKLRPHQANAAWRIVQSGTTLLDHVVGAGKTFTMIAGAMELRRTGRAKKPMFTVPNHLVGQWAEDFTKLYPNANILAATKKDFEKGNRKRLFARIATGDWDAVIVAHSSFGKVEMDAEFQERFINQQIRDIDTAIATIRDQEGKGARSIKQIEKQKDRLQERLKRLFDAENKDDNLTFGELGVDALFLDEAHEFKNLGFATSMTRVAGLGDPKGSQKAADMFMKVQSILERTGGNNVVFATGTPISNTMAEMYTMQRFLDYQTLKDQGIAHFDAWARMYGEVVTDWELSPTGNYKLNSRFSKFVNLPELMQRYLTFGDVINRDDINKQLAEQGKRLPVPKIKGGKPNNIVVERSEDQADYIGVPVKDDNGNESYPNGSLVYRAEHLPKKLEKGQDNMLKIMSDARKAALDMRLIDPALYPDNPASKINEAASRIKTLYDQWSEDKGAQLVFIDLSTPKGAKAQEANRIRDLIQRAENGDEVANEQLDKMSPDELEALDADFSVYDDLRQKLIDKGIPESEIEYIHSANTELQKAELFAKVRTGRVRVMMGSTAKMGAGMNVQTRLVALHHMDAPWRPSDLEQREGRIIRQGNELYDRDPDGFEIEINRYATKQTLDSRMWQTIETKARFIEQVRKGNTKQREIEDLGAESANAAEMKAASSGNPLILEEMDLRQKLQKLEQAEEEHDREQFRIRDAIRREKKVVEQGKDRLLKYAQDVKKAKAAPKDFAMTVNGQTFTKHKDAGQEILAEAAKMADAGTDSKAIGDYAGFAMTLDNVTGTRFVLTLEGALEHQVDIQDIGSADATGLARRATNTISAINAEARQMAARVKQAEKDLPKLEEQVGEWVQADELSKVKGRHQLVIAELQPKQKQGSDQDSDVSAMSAETPMPNWQPTYQMMGAPQRPVSGKFTVGGRTISLKPEDNPTRREGIRVMVIDIIGPRLYQGKIKGKDKLGFYRESNSEVRIANYDDVEVMAHEMAHYLDMHYTQKKRFRIAYRDSRYLNEVQDLSYTDKPKLKAKEGFAEFVRLWLTQHAEAKSRAPLFTMEFDSVLKQDPKLRKKMYRLQEEMHKWYQQGDLAQFYAVTSGNQYTTAQQTTLMLMQRPGQLWRQRYIDKIHAAKVMGRTFHPDSREASEDAYKQLQLLNGIEGIAQESFKRGALVINEDGDITFTGPSLRDVWQKSLKSGPKMLREQELYFIARRASELKRQGRENLITNGMMREGLALAKKHPHFVQAFKDYQAYRTNMMDFYVDSGYVTREAADAMLERNQNYVPFHRVVESVNNAYTGGTGFQRLKGGQQNMKQVYDNMMMQEQRHIYAALKARALQSLYSDALKSQDGSNFLSPIPPDAVPYKVDLTPMAEKTARAMADLGIQISDEGEITGSGDTTVEMEDIKEYFMRNTEELMFWSFGHKPKTTETMVDSFIDKNGKRVWIEITKENRLLVDMLDNMDYVALPEGSLGTAVKTAMAVKNFQTLTITAMAQFVGPNMVRDAQQAFVLSGGRFRPGWDTLIGLGAQIHSLFSQKGAWHEMKAQGGPAAGRVRTFYHENWGLDSDVAYSPRRPFYHPMQWVHSLLDIYMAIADSAEISTRLGFYIRQRNVVGAREAAWQAREISTDFRKNGSYAAWVLLQRTVPFMGAYVQSVDRDIRSLAENKGEMKLANLVKTEEGRGKLADIKSRIWMAGGLVIATTAMLALLNDDEEEYRALTPDQKTRFYHFFFEGTHYTMPKPHGFVSLASEAAEVTMDTLGRQSGDDAWKTMMFAIGYHFGADATPGLINPLAEIAMNRTFTGAPVVNRYAKDREAQYQYDERTPLLYVNAGRALNVSPDQAHHLVQGYTGYLSDFIDEMSEDLLWDTESWGERPFQRNFGDMTAKQFKPKEVPYRTKWTKGYWELRKQAQAAKANLAFLIKGEALRDPDQIAQYVGQEKKRQLMALDKAFNKIDSAFSEQDQVIASIKYNDRLTAEQKETKIENWFRQKNKVMSVFYKQAKDALDQVHEEMP